MRCGKQQETEPLQALPPRKVPRIPDDTIFRDLWSTRPRDQVSSVTGTGKPEVFSVVETKQDTCIKYRQHLANPIPPASQAIRRHCYPIQSYAVRWSAGITADRPQRIVVSFHIGWVTDRIYFLYSTSEQVKPLNSCLDSCSVRRPSLG